MSYIGPEPVLGSFSKQTLVANGVTTAFALDFPIVNAQSILVVANGVVQEPHISYVLTNSSLITFTEAPIATVLYIIYLGKAATSFGVTDDSVSASSIDLSLVAGDLIVGDGIDSWARLPKGAGDEILSMNAGGSALEWIENEGGGGAVGDYAKQTLVANGATTVYALDFEIANANQILVINGGVIQESIVAYTHTAPQQITFSVAPLNGSTLYVLFIGEKFLLAVPATDSIETAMIKDLQVTSDKMADNAIGAAEIDLSIVQGDVIYGTGADAWARLAKGTANQVLAMNAGATAPEWVPAPIQVVSNILTTNPSTTSQVPAANTIFTNTQGTELMTLNITPKSASSKIVVFYFGNVANGTGSTNVSVGVFKDSVVNAKAVFSGADTFPIYNGNQCFGAWVETSGSTSTQTWKYRWGPNAGTGYLGFRGNGGPIDPMQHGMIIMEIV